MESGIAGRRALGRLAAVTLAVALFALAYTRFPFHDGNYDPYLLHGIAAAGPGFLEGDWTATTTDPFPIVSAIARVTYQLGGPPLFYLWHAVLLALYLFGLRGLVVSCYRIDQGSSRDVAFVALMIVVHSTMFRALVTAATGGDWGWYLQSGVAMQYLLGFVFQPSLFGVLLVVSLAAFLRGRDRTAVLLAAGAAAAHASYLITALALIGGYGLVRALDGRRTGTGWHAAARIWLVGAVAIAAIVLWIALHFWPTDATTLAQAQQILVDVRIPHHAVPARWWHPSLAIQLPLIAAGIVAARRSPLAVVMLVLLVASAGLTLAQVVTGSRGLALLFPWRTSVLLVPLSTALVVGRAVSAVPARGWSAPVLAAITAAAALAAAWRGERDSAARARDYDDDPALPMMAYVKSTATATDLYAIPTGLQRFRLETAARVLVDWKTHPYRDHEVIEWYARASSARRLERAEGQAVCDRAAELVAAYGVTHIVVAATKPITCVALTERYRDRDYAVYQASPPAHR